MEALLQTIRQLQGQVVELTCNQQCNQCNGRIDDDTEVYDRQLQATYTFAPPPSTSLNTASHHFSEFFMSVPLPEGFRLSGTLELYDGATDPQEELMMFNSLMLLSRGTDYEQLAI